MTQQTDSPKHPGLMQLRAALVGRTCTGGTCQVPSESLGLYYRKANEQEASHFINLAQASSEKLEALSKACLPATFGRGTEDVLDESYRKAGKMDLDNFATGFDLGCTNILNILRADLVEGYNEKTKAIRAELYKLNVYDKGSFFKAHKDTPRAQNMFASLVIVFPTAHEGGTLMLRHKGQEWNFPPPSSGKSEVGYVAFYSDVEHEVAPVVSGYRVTLTYNLYFEDITRIGLSNDKLMTADTVDTPFKAALQELLSDSSFFPQGGRLGFGLYHQYPFDVMDHESLGRIANFLKGSDATLYRVCKELDLDVDVRLLYTDGYFEVLVDTFANLSEWGPIEEGVPVALRDELDGEIIRGESGEIVRNSADSCLPVLVWATPSTSFNRLEEHFVAYGNQSSAAVVYGDICLIVGINDYASRK